MNRPRRKPRPPGEQTVTVDGLGGQGDGLATADDGRPLYIPFTLPGERVRVRPLAKRGDGWLAEVAARLDPGAVDRAEPVCPHFGVCGGCALQHLDAGAYAAWKRDRVTAALERRGLGNVPVAEPLPVPPGTRRRASLAAVRTADGLVLGFNARLSHRVVDIDHCPLLVSGLDGLLAPLRAALAETLAPGDRAQAQVTATDTGADLVLGLPRPPDLAMREALTAFADAADLARLSWTGEAGRVPEPLVERRPPQVDMGGVAVPFPAGGFLQPSAEGQAALLARVREGLDGARRLADLFAGLGTFALPLAGDGARVRAVETDPRAVAALQRAAGQAGLGGRLTAEARDLEARPLAAGELDGLDAVVLDPPRAGARAQSEALAASTVPRLVMVSCNPATFARDARHLVDGGYRLDGVTPVDQFPFAAHVELVATLVRDA